MLRIIISSLILLSLWSCQQKPSKNDVLLAQSSSNKTSLEKTQPSLEYDFNSPSRTLILESLLSEISGLDYLQSKDLLLAHNDENGKYFQLNKMTGEVVEKISFGNDGDYEGIVSLANNIVIIESNGRINTYDASTANLERKRTVFSSTNDLEGVCQNHDETGLLLACKGQPLGDSKSKSNKAIYNYHIDKNELDEDPFLNISDDILRNWVVENYKDISKSKLKKLKKKVKDFSPSGIAIQPKTKDVFIISARGSTLVRYTKDQSLKSIHFLDDKTIPQPEGICFDAQNNLYIATEGKGFSGKIFVFEYKK